MNFGLRQNLWIFKFSTTFILKVFQIAIENFEKK
jgi:hypothetical protein